MIVVRSCDEAATAEVTNLGVGLGGWVLLHHQFEFRAFRTNVCLTLIYVHR